MKFKRSVMYYLSILRLSCLGAGNGTSKYDNHTLVQIYPRDESQLKSLVKFEDPQHQVEVLKFSRALNDSLDALVPPSRLGFIKKYAEANDLLLEVKNKNYGRSLESPSRTPRRRVLRSNPVYTYNSYATITNFIESSAKSHPELVQLQSIGKSFEGRSMTLVKISSNPNAGNPVIFVDAGIHAREWVAPSMALYLIHRLINDPQARKRELDGVDWYILPVVNPDGYEYTRKSHNHRMWRKTRSPTNDHCFGVDGNRNYGFKWAVSGVSHNPCDSETYAGSKPFSEPETQMVRDIMMDNSQSIKLYVSLHAYGQYLVYPWGFTGEYLPKQWKNLEKLGKMVSAGVERAGGKPFKVMSAGAWYPAAGGSDDFAFGAVGIPYSYTMELTDGHEFIFPERLLPQVLPQFYEGFKVFGAQIRREFSKPRSKRDVEQINCHLAKS